MSVPRRSDQVALHNASEDRTAIGDAAESRSSAMPVRNVKVNQEESRCLHRRGGVNNDNEDSDDMNNGLCNSLLHY